METKNWSWCLIGALIGMAWNNLTNNLETVCNFFENYWEILWINSERIFFSVGVSKCPLCYWQVGSPGRLGHCHLLADLDLTRNLFSSLFFYNFLFSSSICGNTYQNFHLGCLQYRKEVGTLASTGWSRFDAKPFFFFISSSFSSSICGNRYLNTHLGSNNTEKRLGHWHLLADLDLMRNLFLFLFLNFDFFNDFFLINLKIIWQWHLLAGWSRSDAKPFFLSLFLKFCFFSIIFFE